MNIRRRWAQANPVKRSEIINAYLFLLPTLIGFLIFFIGPTIAAVVISFFRWNLLTAPKYIGLDNYAAFFSDPRMGDVYAVTLRFAIILAVSKLLLGLGLAYLLDLKMPNLLRTFFRGSIFFPVIVSSAAVAIIFSFLFNRDLGLINYYLEAWFDIPRINWLLSSQNSPIAVLATDIWKTVGFATLVFYGGLQGIPREYYEAAEVDGASRWQQFRRITLPLLSPTILFLTVIISINSLKIFDIPMIMTQGGPGDATRTVIMYIYETAFRFFDMGYASVVALSLFVITLIVTLIQFRLSRLWVFQE